LIDYRLLANRGSRVNRSDTKDSRQAIARFEAKRQALALGDHFNIARLLDAGETRSARSCFAMELARGMPTTGHCDQNSLTTRQRLELFVTVCQAVQHALSCSGTISATRTWLACPPRTGW
jgi:hypothetical protein